MKTVFFDVDTQIDFMYPAGALYAPGAEKILNKIADLNRYAAANGFPVVSTMDGRRIAWWGLRASRNRQPRCSISE
jgi:nicotinamidase-related amidase